MPGKLQRNWTDFLSSPAYSATCEIMRAHENTSRIRSYVRACFLVAWKRGLREKRRRNDAARGARYAGIRKAPVNSAVEKIGE